MEWEPLPKRARRRGQEKSGASSAAVKPNARAAPTTQQSIEDAVKARIDAHRAKGSLASTDGCPGDNYECQSLYAMFLASKIIFLNFQILTTLRMCNVILVRNITVFINLA
jgi:hypothetical protein